MSDHAHQKNDHTSPIEDLPLVLSFEITKKRPSYVPRSGKKVNGMRATGPVMGCPGRKHCVYGDLCPVEIDDTPFNWTACAIELKRYEDLAGGLRFWILEARVRPMIVEPEWLEELSEAFIEKQIFSERFRRYVLGMELDSFSREYLEDPVVQRFEKRSQEQGLELRFYIADLVSLLRVARAHDRMIPLPGHHQRRAWWEQTPKAAPKKKRSTRQEGRKLPGKKKPRNRKTYRPHVVKTIIKNRRRSAS